MVSCCGRSAWRPVMYGLAAVMEYYYRSASTRRGWISGVASRSPCEAKMRVSMDRRLPANVRSWRAVERRSISQLSPSIGCSIIETRCIPEIRGGRRGWRILTGHGTSVRDPFPSENGIGVDIEFDRWIVFSPIVERFLPSWSLFGWVSFDKFGI